MDLVELVRAVHRGPLSKAQARAICKAIGTRQAAPELLLAELRSEWPEIPWRAVRQLDALGRRCFVVRSETEEESVGA